MMLIYHRTKKEEKTNKTDPAPKKNGERLGLINNAKVECQKLRTAQRRKPVRGEELRRACNILNRLQSADTTSGYCPRE